MTSINWAVRRNLGTYKEINEYFERLNGKKYSAKGPWEDKNGREYSHDFLIFPNVGKSRYVVKEMPKGYVEIHYSDFISNIVKKEISYDIY